MHNVCVLVKQSSTVYMILCESGCGRERKDGMERKLVGEKEMEGEGKGGREGQREGGERERGECVCVCVCV